MLRVHSLETFGTQEGPGLRLVVFLQGCNFRCQYCHNPDTWEMTSGKLMSVREIIDWLEEERPYFSNGGGLTISGGEPLLQAQELIPLFTEAKRRGFQTALDTNASLKNKDTEKLWTLTDLGLIDLKQINDDKHRLLTGQSNRIVLETINDRNRSGQPFWIRYVLVPGFSDEPTDLKAVGEFLQTFKFLERLEILPYHSLGQEKYQALGRDYPLAGVPAPTVEAVSAAAEIFKTYLPNRVIIR
jgi:pyruvate formate lyase activating enzyme